MTDQDIHDFFEDHLDTLNSIITKNGYINNRIPKDYENLTTQSLINYLSDKYKTYGLDINGSENERHLLSGLFNHTTENKLLMVFFCNSTDFKMIYTQALKIISNYENKNYSFDCVVVTNKPVRASSKTTMFENNIFKPKLYSDDIFFDISESIFVPKVLRKLKPSDEIFKNIDTKKFPKIILNDPLCYFYLCSVGDILELERDVDVDGISDTQIVYRTVVPIPFSKKNSK